MRLIFTMLACCALSVVSHARTIPLNDDAAISYVQRDGSSYQWNFWHKNTERTERFLTSPFIPRHVFWNVSEEKVIYTLGNQVFSASTASAPAKPAKLGELPSGAGKVSLLWLDRTSARLRVATMAEVGSSNVLRTKNGLRYRLADGTTIDGIADPSWGLPYVVTVFELDRESRSWKRLARRATKDDAGLTPGISVIDDMRDEAGFSSLRLFESASCREVDCRSDVPAELVTQASQRMRHALNSDELSIWPDDPKRPALLFGTIMGDELHITNPLLLVTEGRRSVVTLPTHDRRQMALSMRGAMLLVTDEGGDNPLVFDLANGKPVFRAKATQAVWIPHAADGK